MKTFQKIFDRGQEIFYSRSGSDCKRLFFNQTNYVKQFLWAGRIQIWHPCRKLIDKMWKNFRSISGNDGNFFSKNTFCLEMFLWTRRLLFWQFSWENFRQIRGNFLLMVRKECKHRLSSKTSLCSWKCFSGLVESSFSKLAEKKSRQGRKNFAQST